MFFMFFVAVFALRSVSLAASLFETPLKDSSCTFEACQFDKAIRQPPLPLWLRVQALGPLPAEGPLGKWRLVRTAGPEKQRDIISIMHTADLLQSDPEFAGLTIRCRPKSALQIAFIVITPFRPRTHPAITVSLIHSSMRFKGEVIPPGSMVALPDEADVLLKGPWQSASQLVVDIEGDGTKIHGTVSLEGLSSAIAFLQSNCTVF